MPDKEPEETGLPEHPGGKLRAAREAAGLSLDDVSDDLHLSRNVLLALEEGDYELLGAPVFVKGHLRSYARLLGLPEHEIAAGLQASEPPPEEFRTLSARTELKPGANLSNFVLWVLLSLLLLLGVIYFLLGGEEDEVADFIEVEPAAALLQQKLDEAPAQELPLVDEPVVAAEQSPQAEVADEAGDPAATSEPAAVAVAEPAATPAPASVPPVEPVANPELVSLALDFSAECWVEISDARRRLLYGLEKAGSSRRLEGEPPFRFFLGNTEAVDIMIAGQPYTVPVTVRTGNNTARFTVDAAAIAGLVN